MLCLLKTPIDSMAVSQQALLLCLYSLFHLSVAPLKRAEGKGEGTVIAELGKWVGEGDIEGSRKSPRDRMITKSKMGVFSNLMNPYH